MSTTNMPGFTAEISLARTTRQYRSAAGGLPASGVITPQAIVETLNWAWGWGCPPTCYPIGYRRCHCPVTHLE
jgi:hypothetical protein